MNPHATSGTTEPRNFSVPALARGYAVLDFVGHKGYATFTEIQQGLGISKSTLHNLLGTLVGLKMLRASGTGYALGFRLFELGSLAVAGLDLRKEAKPVLHALATSVRLTCHLGILDEFTGVYLLKDEVEHIIKVTSWEGKRVRLLSSGLGKVLVAWQTPSVINAIIDGYHFVAYTPNTLTEPAGIRTHLAEIRQRGWAVDDEEDGEGVRCVAAPVLNRAGEIIASISACGTTQQLPLERLPALAEEVRAACARLAAVVGYTGLERR